MISWPQDFATNFQFLLRWIHFLAGITWIGMLYFFNLVNVQFQKELDAATKGKVNPPCSCRRPSSGSAGARCSPGSRGSSTTALLANSEETGHTARSCIFLVGWSIAFVVRRGALPRRGRRRRLSRTAASWRLVIAIVVVVHRLRHGPDGPQPAAPRSRTISIMVGGGHRNDHVPERLDDHLAAPEEDHRGGQGDRRDGRARRRPIRPKWARRAFLASRTNAWLSIPMLFFMGAASHFPIFSTIEKIAAP